jgi:hydrogenase expression/formation protein HypC
MCLAAPGRIIAFLDGDKQLASVDVSGVRRTINTALIAPDGLECGDWVLIHVGFAMSRIDEVEARRTLELLAQLGGDDFEADREGGAG